MTQTISNDDQFLSEAGMYARERRKSALKDVNKEEEEEEKKKEVLLPNLESPNFSEDEDDELMNAQVIYKKNSNILQKQRSEFLQKIPKITNLPGSPGSIDSSNLQTHLVSPKSQQNNVSPSKHRKESFLNRTFSKILSPKSRSPSLISPLQSPKMTDLKLEEEKPNNEDIEIEFQKIIVDMGITNKKFVFEKYKTIDDKWNLVKLMKIKIESQSDQKQPKYFIEELKKNNLNLKNIKELNIELKSSPLSWVEEFLNLNGLKYLNSSIAKLNFQTNNSNNLEEEIQLNLIKSFYIIVNIEMGMNYFLNEKDCLRNLIILLDSKNLNIKSKILYLFALITQYSEDGLLLCLDAISHFKLVKREPFRFATIRNLIMMDYISTNVSRSTSLSGAKIGFGTTGNSNNTIPTINTMNELSTDEIENQLRIHSLMFLNSILSSISLYKSLEFKVDIIKEFKNLNLKFKKNSIESTELFLQIELFESEISMNDLKPDEINPPIEILKNQMMNNLNSISKIPLNLIFKYLIEVINSSENESKLSEDLIKLYDFLKGKETFQDKLITQKNIIDNLEESNKIKNEKLENYIQNWISFPFQNDKENLILKNEFEKNNEIKMEESSNILFQLNQIKQIYIEKLNKTSNQMEEKNDEKVTPKSMSNSSPPSRPPPPPPSSSVPTGGPNAGPTGGPPMMSSGGGPPAPPGIGGPPIFGMNTKNNLPSISKKKSRIPTKRINLENIKKNKVKESIFVKKGICENTIQCKINEEEIEELFSNELINKNGTNHGTTDLIGLKEEKKLISLLDSKRSYQISIKLKSLKGVTLEDIYKGILLFNEEIINEEVLEIISTTIPTDEEKKLFFNFKGNSKELEYCDYYFYLICPIKNLKERIEIWQFKNKFQQEVENLRLEIESIIFTVKELNESESFFKFLSLILTYSNYLNKQDSYGFHLNSLKKLIDIKTKNRKSNLLFYIIEKLEDSNEESIYNFYNELKNISISKKINMNSIRERLNEIKIFKNLLDDLLDKDNEIEKKFKSFHEILLKEYSLLKERFDLSIGNLKKLSVLYDEDESMMLQKPEEFFNLIDSFIITYKISQKKVKTLREKREAIEMRKKKKEKEDKYQNSDQSRNLLHSIEESLRDGSILLKNQKKFYLNKQGEDLIL
eukprot:gene634-8137_t